MSGGGSSASARSTSRAIRVFVSSTFRDMQLEREELVKRVFPEVRRRCEARGVTWAEVDLRWGVTDEQKAEGAVLPICLAEIERSRPHFIGLLGQRYGWIPDEIPAAIAQELGWLTDASGRSVTELEILHGVLNDPDSAGHAYFYLRDPAWVAALPVEEQPTYQEQDARGVELLETLKDRVRQSSHPVRVYDDPVDLAEVVLQDLIDLVDRLYPDATPPDPLDRAAGEHAAFAASRFAGFVPRAQLAARLDEHASGEGSPLLVSGDAGMGSSALVADWAQAWQLAHPDDIVIEHYAGASSTAADWRAMTARLGSELARRHGLDVPDVDAIPQEPAALRSFLGQALRQAAAAERTTLLVLDGVDRLVDDEGAPDLRWLPAAPPPQVRIILTAGPGRAREAALHRGWPILDVPPLDRDERRAVITTFLSRFSKALDDVHVNRLLSSPLTGNPLFLRTVLDELRQHGDHYTLGDVIERLLSSQSGDDLFEQVLTRYEQDFERDRPGLTRDAFTALWAARHGLAESELLDLLGTEGNPLPHAVWSPLFLAAEHGLVTRSGLLSFATRHLRIAVEDRYLTDDASREEAHRRLATYFATRPLGDRVVDELPWQQLDGGNPTAATQTLADHEFFELAYRRALPDVRRLWARLEADGHSMAEAYRAVIADPAAYDGPGQQTVWGVARLLTDSGHPAEAMVLHRALVDQARRHPAGSKEADGGDARLRAALLNLGAALLFQGDLAAADIALTEVVERNRASGDQTMLSAALGNLAMVRRERGDLADAEDLFAQDEAICRDLDDLFGLQATLGNQAELLRRQGRYDEALVRLEEQERVCRDVADRAGVLRALAGKAAILADRGELREALAATAAHGEAAREIGDARGLAESMLNQAVLLSQLGDPRADATAREAEALARGLGDGGLLSRVLAARVFVLLPSGAWPEAERLALEAELTARNAGAMGQVAVALGMIGTARREQGDLPGSLQRHRQELEVAESTGDRQAVAAANVNLGNVHIASGDAAEALDRFARAEPTFRELQAHSTLLPMLANRGQLRELHGDLPGAVSDYDDAAQSAARLGLFETVRQWGERGIQLAYQVGDTVRAESLWRSLALAYRAVEEIPLLQRTLGEQAVLMINRAQQAIDPNGATPDLALLANAAGLLDEQEEICRRTGDQVGLAACIGNKAIVHRYQGDLVLALQCVDEQLALAQATNNAQGVLFATANRGELLGLVGRPDEAREALRWARQTAAGYGLQPMVQQLDQMIAALPT